MLVRYFAGAAEAAGVEEEEVVLAPDATLDDLKHQLALEHPALRPVLGVASLLVDAVARVDPAYRVGDASGVDVLPPFSGG